MRSLVAVFLSAVLGAVLSGLAVSAVTASVVSSVCAFLLRLVELDVFRTFAASLRERHLVYHLLQELLYLLEPVLVFFAHEGDGSTIAVGTGCTADAVNVIFCIVRNIVIDDHLNIIDVDSARHNVGSYENIILSALELEHHIIALSLFQVAVHGSAVYSNLLEGSCELLHLEFAAAEDDDTLQVACLEDVLDDGHLLGFVAYVCFLLDFLGWLADGKFDFYRILEQGLSQFFYLLRHGCREHDGLAGVWQFCRDGLDVFRETHVEHAVGLVEDEEAYLAEVYIAQRYMGDEAARGGDDYIGAHAEAAQLLIVTVAVVAAVYGYAAHALQVIAEALHRLVYLLGEFAGW